MQNLRLFQRVLSEVRPCWPHLAVIFGLGLLATPLGLLLPLPLKIVVDSVIGDHPTPAFLEHLGMGAPSKDALLALAAAFLIAATLLNLLLALANNLLSEYVGESMVLAFRSRLFQHAQELSLAFHDAQGTAHSLYRVQWDAPAVRWLTLDGVIPLITAVFTFGTMIGVTSCINLKLAVVALVVSPALMILTYFYSKRLRVRWREVHSVENSAFGVIQEVLGALRVVNAFGQEQRERDRFYRQSVASIAARARAALMESSLDLLIGSITAGGTAAVLLVGARDVLSGAITLGDLLLVTAYLSQLYAPLKTIGKQVAGQQRSLASFERAIHLLDQAPAVVERANARSLDRAQGALEFRKVSFGYTEASPVLREISFDVPAGTRVGIIGATGAGKTTLLSLLIRFYDPTAGRILLDGTDLRELKLADLRSQYAIVLQEPVLFSTTVAENIAYARPEATEEEIVAAARAAHAHDFIAGMPGGYDTVVGERGMRLSGGERQRISLARAFLKDAPILILDEPTSSVDLATEAVIMDALHHLMRGRTTFMIAHRLTTLSDCDLLLRIESGRVSAVTSEVRASLREASRFGEARRSQSCG